MRCMFFFTVKTCALSKTFVPFSPFLPVCCDGPLYFALPSQTVFDFVPEVLIAKSWTAEFIEACEGLHA